MPATKIMLQELDKSVGAILDALSEHGLEENTFVFFFSDNGDVGKNMTIAALPRRQVQQLRGRASRSGSREMARPHQGGLDIR